MQGRPVNTWLQLFLLTHRRAAEGWQRLEWPDGQPLLAQSWPAVVALCTLGDELARVAAEQRRSARGRAPRGAPAPFSGERPGP